MRQGNLLKRVYEKWVVEEGGRVQARTRSPSASGRLISRPAAPDANSWLSDAVFSREEKSSHALASQQN